MASNPLRFPKGVPREIVKALRLGKKQPGQFLDYETAFRLRDALRSYYTPTPKEPRRPSTPRKKPAPKPLPKPAPQAAPPEAFEDFPEPAPEEPGAVEYEVGIDYKAGVSSSNVAFNARFFRRDGRRMTEDEARDVLRHMIYTGQAPDGIDVQEVYWQRRKHGRKRYGGPGHLPAFFNILQEVGDGGMETTPLRLGAVKPNRL